MKIRPGDLVVPVDCQEFLFSSPEDAMEELEPISAIWTEDRPAIVIEVLRFDPPRDYDHIKVIVDDVIGWTCSDYVKRIRRIIKKHE